MWLRLLLLLGVCSTFTVVTASGAFFGHNNNDNNNNENVPRQSGQTVLFAVEGSMVHMHMTVEYQAGSPQEFAWILPVPNTPTLALGTDVLFHALEETTRPRFELEIDDSASKSCQVQELIQPFACPPQDMMVGRSTGSGSTATTTTTAHDVASGSVGPMDFVMLESDATVMEWLNQHDYDKPPQADALFHYYAVQGYSFVALRWNTNTSSHASATTGELQPIVLTYELPRASPDQAPTLSLPLQLTRLAATEELPVTVYVLGESRAVPLHHVDVTLDDAFVDWVGCWEDPACHDDNYHQRLEQAVGAAGNMVDPLAPVFTTDYAGATADRLTHAVAINLTAIDLYEADNPVEFLERLVAANVPATHQVVSIVNRHIPPMFHHNVPPLCRTLATVYQLNVHKDDITTRDCLWNYQPTPEWRWDPIALAIALEEHVFIPSRTAQEMVLQYPYLTRLYTQLSLSTPSQSRDAHFAVRHELADSSVDNRHVATAVPTCRRSDGTPESLEITIDTDDQKDKDGKKGDDNDKSQISVPATLGCEGWFPTEAQPLDVSVATASYLTVWSSVDEEDEEPTVVERHKDGTFQEKDLQEVMDVLHTVIVNQTSTIPDYIYTVGGYVEVLVNGTNDTSASGGATTLPSPPASLQEEYPPPMTNTSALKPAVESQEQQQISTEEEEDTAPPPEVGTREPPEAVTNVLEDARQPVELSSSSPTSAPVGFLDDYKRAVAAKAATSSAHYNNKGSTLLMMGLWVTMTVVMSALVWV